MVLSMRLSTKYRPKSRSINVYVSCVLGLRPRAARVSARSFSKSACCISSSLSRNATWRKLCATTVAVAGDQAGTASAA